jgi:hypothetical protein
LPLVVPRIPVLHLFDFLVLPELELVYLLIQLGNLVHQALVPRTVLPHLHCILLQKPILLELDLLQSLHLLRNLLLQLLLQSDYHSTTVVQQIC